MTRSIPTSSVNIKPKTRYSYSGPTDGVAKQGNVAKPHRAKQLIQAPVKNSSGKKNTSDSKVAIPVNKQLLHSELWFKAVAWLVYMGLKNSLLFDIYHLESDI